MSPPAPIPAPLEQTSPYPIFHQRVKNYLRISKNMPPQGMAPFQMPYNIYNILACWIAGYPLEHNITDTWTETQHLNFLGSCQTKKNLKEVLKLWIWLIINDLVNEGENILTELYSVFYHDCSFHELQHE